MPKISIPQRQMSFEVESGINLMNALLLAGLPVASSCQGDAVCSMCRVVVEGETTAPDKVEHDCLVRNKAQPAERLSCQISVTHDLVVRTKYW